ncbi:MAG: hypothetical protein HY377_00955 [Candidatus Blackburnbacteria bacterium]|nr:hypothetical protein [Candidatus Blackburnbacteria bacterium]
MGALLVFLFTFALTGALAWQYIIPGLEGKLAFSIPLLQQERREEVKLEEGNISLENIRKLLSESFLSSAGGSILGDVAIQGELKVGTSTLTISPLGALTTNQSITVGGTQIINALGKIPALISDYFTSLDATKLTGKIYDADHLDGISSSSFLRSDESDTASGAINFTASPGSVNVGGGPVYINPAAATSNYTLFGVAINDSSRFRVDAEGDVVIQGDLTVSGTSATLPTGSISKSELADAAKSKTTATFIVCANNAQDTTRCDYVADGTADDVQVQAAIDALPSGGGTVVLSEGTFTFSTSVTIGNGDDNVWIKGAGQDTTTISGALAADIPYIKINTSLGITITDLRISDFTIDATSHVTSTSVAMIYQDGLGVIERLTIENLTINTANTGNHGIGFINDSGTNKYIRILNNNITTTGSQVYGIMIRKPTNYLWVENNYVSLSDTGSWNSIAVYADTKYFHVNNNTVIGAGHTPIAVSPGSYGEITGNVVDGSGVSDEGGIEVEWKAAHEGVSTSHHINVANNVVFSANWGIYIHRRDTGAIAPYDIIISGNVISDSTICINLVEATDITVYGNHYESCTTKISKGSSVTTKQFAVETALVTANALTVTADGATITAGNLGIAAAQTSNVGVQMGTITGINSIAYNSNNTFTLSANSTSIQSFASLATVATTASNFSLTNFYGFRFRAPSKTGSGAITNAYGMYVGNPTIGGNSNYGVYIEAPSGASTNNIGLYNAGTTTLVGNVGVGTSLDATLNYINIDTLNADTAGPPTSTDCDASGEVGRMIVSTRYSATEEFKLWVCTQTGASTFGWKSTTLN